MLHTPVNSIIATRNGTAALAGMMGGLELRPSWDGMKVGGRRQRKNGERDEERRGECYSERDS